MKKIIEHIHSRPPHHRRRISMQISAVVTVLVFIAWFATLPLRLSQTPPSVADKNSSSLVAGAAAAGSQFENQFNNIKAQLQVIQGNPQTETKPNVTPSSAPATQLSGQPIDQSN